MNSGFVSMVSIALLVLGLSASTSQAAKHKLKQKIVTGTTLNCDSNVCKTDIGEIHSDDVGVSEEQLVFHPPAGVSLDQRSKGGVEIEGGGATHYVNALACWAQLARLQVARC